MAIESLRREIFAFVQPFLGHQTSRRGALRTFVLSNSSPFKHLMTMFEGLRNSAGYDMYA